ncbi:MAG TPA: Gfo/Idh/MocA family oxidoreductase [Bryobacteraceae bacterium]|nr:Gfo/Idh/MocA family oxidoreductase [Bryobacteraceae bacterium]
MLRIGIIGAGGAALGIHVPGFRLCPDVEIAGVCDTNPKAGEKIGAPWVTADYRDLLARDDIDAVVNATPNDQHHEIALATIASGKHILCEKPLSLNASLASEMLRAAEAAGVVHMTAFTYRYTPALQYMMHLAASDELGAIRTVRAAYQMALSGHLLGWRSTKAQAGSGVLADIGSHLIHMVELVAGPIASLSASDRRFRDDPASDVEDWSAFLAGFSSGATGIFEISRVCAGRGAGITENVFIEVYGTRGAAVFSLQDPWGLMVALGESAKDPARLLDHVGVPDQFLKLANSPRDIHAHDPRWGYRYDQAWQFVESIRMGQTRSPSFADGVRCQAVLDAVLASTASRQWVNV